MRPEIHLGGGGCIRNLNLHYSLMATLYVIPSRSTIFQKRPRMMMRPAVVVCLLELEWSLANNGNDKKASEVRNDLLLVAPP